MEKESYHEMNIIFRSYTALILIPPNVRLLLNRSHTGTAACFRLVVQEALKLIDRERNFSVFILHQGQVVLHTPTDFRLQTEQECFYM